MTHRLAGILLAAILSVGLASTPALALDNKIQEIQDRGVLRACLAEAIPNNYKNPKTEEWEGFNVDMGQVLAEEMGVEIEWVDSTWATVIQGVLTDKCDVALVGLFRLAKRAAVILFVDAFNFLTLSAAVAENSTIDSYEEIDDPNVTLAVISGTAEEAYFKSKTRADVRSMVTDKISTVFMEVASKRVDAAVTDTTTLRMFIKANPAMHLRELNAEPIAPKGTSWAVAPGEYHFQQFLNVFLERTITSGLKDELWAKWHPDE